MTTKKYKDQEISLAPGERVIVRVRGALGRLTGQAFELRSTPMPEESPNAHLVEVIEHVPERSECCATLLECLSVPPKEAKVYEEIMRQRNAEAQAKAAEFSSLIEAFTEIFGGASVFVADESGVHPVKKDRPTD